MRLGSAALLAVVVAFAAGCSIDHRSDTYACTTSADCSDGRRCDNGYCIVTGSLDAPRADAKKPTGDASNCPPGCTTCNLAQKTCTIDCQLTSCTNEVTCPPGYKCEIECNVDNACRNGVDCTAAASCSVDCTGKGSCEGVECGPGPCDVGCSGPSSCRGVACNNSCACDVLCTGSQSCQEGIQCSSFACRSTNGRGCTSVPALCHSCN